MNYKYDFSFIVPVYNAEKYLRICVDSVLNQKYDLNKIEIILINDGSSDNSLEICQQYAERNNINLINQKNQGVSIARNNGLKQAKGKYVVFLDSDDFVSDNLCKELFLFFEDNYELIDLVTYPLLNYKDGKLSSHFRYSKLYSKNNMIYDIDEYSELIQTTINICIKNNLEIEFDENLKFSEDEKFATSIIMKKSKFGYCSSPNYYYRKIDTSSTKTYSINEEEFNKYSNYYEDLLKKYPNKLYIKNLFLNTLRWRINECKLIPDVKKMDEQKKYLNKIKKILIKVDSDEIMGLSFLNDSIKTAIFELKGIKFKTLPTVTINKLEYESNPILSGIIKNFNYEIDDTLLNNDDYKFEYEKIIKYECSGINNVFEYKFRIFLKNKTGIIDFSFLSNKIIFNIKNKTYKFIYKIYNNDSKIIIEKMRISDIIKKVRNKIKILKVGVNVKMFIKKILQKLRQIVYISLYKLFCIFNRLDDNKVLFLSASRASLTGNFKFVYDEIKKRKKYKINMMLKSNLKIKYSIKQKIKLVRLIATSKYIFLDDFYPMIYALKLRKGTELIQLWHAMGAFKTVGYSRMNKEGGPSKHSLTHKNYTGTIVSSESIRENYAEAFGISIDKVHALGVPRTDIFFNEKYAERIKNKLYKKYPVLKEKKVILFAPTFRGNGQKSAHYNFEWFDLKKFSETFNKDYVCIFKLHPFIKNKPDYDIENDPFYIDLTSEREINDLLFVTDILITDYSSVIFEYSFFKKPVIFFTPDLEEYKNSRDFYYPLEKYTYGEVAKNFDDLIKKVKQNKINKKKLDKFYEFFCSSCDGHSTKRVVDFFLGK